MALLNTLLNTIRTYALRGAVVGSIVAVGYVSHRLLFEIAHQQGYEEGQQEKIRHARRNLEQILHLDCGTNDNRTYAMPLFHEIYADPDKNKNAGPDKNQRSLEGLELSMYCDGPSTPHYPRIRKGYPVYFFQVTISEEALDVRWRENTDLEDGWRFQPNGLNTFRKQNQKP